VYPKSIFHSKGEEGFPGVCTSGEAAILAQTLLRSRETSRQRKEVTELLVEGRVLRVWEAQGAILELTESRGESKGHRGEKAEAKGVVRYGAKRKLSAESVAWTKGGGKVKKFGVKHTLSGKFFTKKKEAGERTATFLEEDDAEGGGRVSEGDQEARPCANGNGRACPRWTGGRRQAVQRA